jgi:hypothetical protein
MTLGRIRTTRSQLISGRYSTGVRAKSEAGRLSGLRSNRTLPRILCKCEDYVAFSCTSLRPSFFARFRIVDKIYAKERSNTMKKRLISVLCWPLTLLCNFWNDAGGPNYETVNDQPRSNHEAALSGGFIEPVGISADTVKRDSNRRHEGRSTEPFRLFSRC